MNLRQRAGHTPLVSVLIPAYNAAATLAPALRSILTQTWRALEVVVVDDGSTDGTRTLLDDFARRDRRIRVVSKPNGGIVTALNHGWALCAGDYVARMDADDLSLPWRIGCQVRHMERNPALAASGTGILPFQARFPFVGLPARFPADDAGVRTRLLFNPPIMHPTAIFRRALLGSDAPYSSAMPQAEDYELWTRLAASHRLGNIPAVCLLYRRSMGSISQSRREDQACQATALRLRNLSSALGAEFAQRHADSHAELMLRRHAPDALVRGLPDYVETLLAQESLSSSVIAQVWLSYCASFRRQGGDGDRLYRQARGAHGATGRVLLRVLLDHR